MNTSKRKDVVIDAALNYLVKTQRTDGSWNGPLSSRVRETHLVYETSRILGWKDLEKKASNWLQKNSIKLGDNIIERKLNREILNVYNQKKVVLMHKSFYSLSIVRKVLAIFILGKVNNLKIETPNIVKSEDIIGMIDFYIDKSKGQIKGWALCELISYKSILISLLGVKDRKILQPVLESSSEDNWYRNIATTCFCLIAAKLCGIDIKFSKYKKFIEDSIQEDGGWSYCAIPLWDTGLSIDSLILSQRNDKETTRALERGLKFIYKNQNADGGWGFDIGLESEADTTSIILNALRTSKNKKSINKAIKYFARLQFKKKEFKGLWPVWRQSEQPSNEVVGHIITALKNYDTKINLTYGIEWLQKKIDNKQWKAEWGRNLPYAVYAILSAKGVKHVTHSLIKYLFTNQNKNGGWGAMPGEKSNASATANAILALKLIKNSRYTEIAIEKGLEYLYDTQLPNGTWPRVKEVIGPRPFIYADDSSTHNFVLQSLLK